jgi:hypothetical protein
MSPQEQQNGGRAAGRERAKRGPSSAEKRLCRDDSARGHARGAFPPFSGIIIYIVREEALGDLLDCTVHTGGDGPRLERGE